MRQLRDYNLDDDDIVEIFSEDNLLFSGKYADVPEELTLYAVQKKLRIYDVIIINI